MIRLIASDMDGTLLNAQGQMSERTVREIKKVQENGVIFAVCTGRIYSSARTEPEKHGIHCSYLCNSGAQIFDESGKLLRSIPLERETAYWIMKELKKYRVPLEIQAEDSYYVTYTFRDVVKKCYYRWRNKRLSGYLKRILFQYLPGKKNQSGADKPIRLRKPEDVFLYSNEIYKISSSGISPKKVTELKKYFQSTGKVTAVSSFSDNVEITDIRAQKGPSLAWYAEHLGISPDEVMAVGDSDNDLSMIQWDFGYTVAMGNAMDCIKEAAKYRTLDNTEDGVAVFMEQHIPLSAGMAD